MKQKRIVIIGAGMAGLCMAVQLRRQGYRNFQILEKAGDIGGTWRDNSYPGCACDVPSHLYSFSFAGNPNWSRLFPPRDEIFAYMKRLAKKHGIYQRVTFNAELAKARFDEKRAQWQLTLANGKKREADILISALGQLNRPKIPHFDGAQDFKGAIFHSARWQHDIDLRGERVAVIGNGPSAAQIIPEIANKAAHLTVFQRSPCHVMPRNDLPYSALTRALFKLVPGLRRAYRGLIYWQLEKNFITFNSAQPTRRIIRFLARFDPLANKLKTHFREQVSDRRLRKALWPSYPIGCKRVVISDDYLPALQRPNVTLVTDAIKRITANGIKDASGQQHDFDVIIYGTGFESTEFLAPIEIIGAQKTALKTVWRDGAHAYLGITMPHFPNFFMLYGPNTNLGHNSIIFMIECQVRYVLSALAALRKRKARALALKPARMADFDAALQAQLATTVWESDCDSWYKNQAGRVTNNWPNYTYDYAQRTRRLDATDYDFAA